MIARAGHTTSTTGVSPRYEDLEQLQPCFEGWDIELIQLGPHRHSAWASMAELPFGRVIRVHAGRPVVVRGTAPPVDGCLMLSSSSKTAIRWLGQPIDGSRFALAGKRARIDLFLPCGATLCAITAESLPHPCPRRMQIHKSTPECVSTLVHCAQSTTDNEACPGAGHSRLALDAALFRHVHIALEASVPVPPATSMRTQRANAVVCACRFIDSHLGESIGLVELCKHCGVSVRTLEYGFRLFYDTTPIGFIKSQRLTCTRRLLTQARAQPPLISKTAKRMGFTHMGQYGRDYRSLFGESPTMTLQRSQQRHSETLLA